MYTNMLSTIVIGEGGLREIDRDRERETDIERDRQRETDKERSRHTDIQIETNTE